MRFLRKYKSSPPDPQMNKSRWYATPKVAHYNSNMEHTLYKVTHFAPQRSKRLQNNPDKQPKSEKKREYFEGNQCEKRTTPNSRAVSQENTDGEKVNRYMP